MAFWLLIPLAWLARAGLSLLALLPLVVVLVTALLKSPASPGWGIRSGSLLALEAFAPHEVEGPVLNSRPALFYALLLALLAQLFLCLLRFLWGFAPAVGAQQLTSELISSWSLAWPSLVAGFLEWHELVKLTIIRVARAQPGRDWVPLLSRGCSGGMLYCLRLCGSGN